MKKDAKKYILLLLASLALHLGVFYTAAIFSDFLFYNELRRLLDHKIVDKTKDLSTQIELVDLDIKQVVDQNKKSINETPSPEDTKFVSQNDQTVAEETKAKNNGAFRNSNNKPSNQASASTSAPTVSFEDLMQAGRRERERLEKLDLGLRGLSNSQNPDTMARRRTKALKRLSRAGGAWSYDTGPSQTDDHLKDIKEGSQTLLNTRRTKFFSFYSRIKGQLRSHWNPLIREEVSFIYSTKRSPASLGVKKTSLKITLDQDGYLEEIALLKTSGNKAIDNAAIQALRLSAPFPNPPKGMREKDKKIRIFWDFVLET